jgi:hypothetical protein
MTPLHGFCPKCGVKLPAENPPSVWIKLGLVFAIVAIFFLPLVFGTMGILCGLMDFRQNKPAGLILIGVNAICMTIGTLLKINYGDLMTNYF